MKPTPEDKRRALLHATVWSNVFHEMEGAGYALGDRGDRKTVAVLATFALVVGGEYRRIYNGADLDP
jgi:hypothetical protein